MNRPSSKLAALSGIRQIGASLRADRAADAASEIVLRVWNKIKRLLKRPPHYFDAHRAVIELFGDGIAETVINDVAAHLARTVRWGQATAKVNLETTLPEAVLRAAALQQVTEGRDDAGLDRHASDAAESSSNANGLLPVLHDNDPADDLDGAGCWGVSVSRTQLLESALTVADILFPAYTSAEVAHVVYSTGWEQRLRDATKLAAPDRLASILSAGLAAGKSQREIAKDLRPVVQGVQVTARRIARTETLRVAQDTQMRCHDALGDLVIGFQVHATLDSHTRPWHAHRSGQVYYKRPKPGQLGPLQMPNPPEEPRDPTQRPPDAPATAWNCRCYLSPVLTDPGDLHAGFTPAVTPDPLVYSEWFAGADERSRRTAVGSRRYSLVRDRHGSRRPEWSDFLHPESGELLSLPALKAETPIQRAERATKVQATLAARRADAQQVSQQGFLSAPKAPLVKTPTRKVALPSGRVIRFMRHEAAGAREVMVMIDPAKLSAAWEADDPGQFVGPGGEGGAGRRAAAIEFFAKGIPIQAPRVYIGIDGRIAFTDGRHRFGLLRDVGAPRVGVMVPRDQAAAFRERFG